MNGLTKDELKQLIFVLAVWAEAPEGAPEDWYHHGEENLQAWKNYIERSHERGYYAVPALEEDEYEKTTI